MLIVMKPDAVESEIARVIEVIERLGYRVIRFQNEQVLHHLDQVLAAIQAACLKKR